MKDGSPLGRMGKIFLAGAVAILPVAATVGIIALLLKTAYDWLGPGSWFGGFLIALGYGSGGVEIARYFFGLFLVLSFIFFLGLTVELGAKRLVDEAGGAVMGRVPMLKNVYETVKSLVALLSREPGGKMQGMQPVWITFGERGGAVVLGLLSCPQPVQIGDRVYRTVIVPTAPVPIGGGLFFVPEENVEAADIGIDVLTGIYVSMGISMPDGLGNSQGRLTSSR